MTAVLHYRRKNTAILWFTACAKVVTAKKWKTAYRQKLPLYCVTAMFWFTAYAKFVTAKNEKTANLQHVTAVCLRPRLCPPKKTSPTITVAKIIIHIIR